LIGEDDIEFLNPGLFINQMNTFLSRHNNWDVLLLAGNNVPPHVRDGDECVKISRCQTTTGYLVNGHYYDILIENIKNSIVKLLREPEKHIKYAIDRYWFFLQKRDNWYLLTPLIVVQREGYSDIAKKVTNFVNIMTDLDKKERSDKYMKRLEETSEK
jgi:hypothetical protein